MGTGSTTARTADDQALSPRRAQRTWIDLGFRLPRVPPAVAGTTDLLSSNFGKIGYADRARLQYEIPSTAGYVTSFAVDENYRSRLGRHTVGSAVHEECWIPAQELSQFNKAIVGLIAIGKAFLGDSFAGFIPGRAGLKGKTAEDQFLVSARVWDYGLTDFTLEISANRKAVYLNAFSGWAMNSRTSVSTNSISPQPCLESWKPGGTAVSNHGCRRI